VVVSNQETIHDNQSKLDTILSIQQEIFARYGEFGPVR
jgi:hypothetical protein